MKVWRKVLILLMLMVFIAGLGFLLYPYLQGAIADYRITQEAHEFLEMVETRPTQPEETIPVITEPVPTEPEETEPVLHPELLDAMKSYNSQIWAEKQSGLCDPWAYEQPSFKLGDYGLEDEVFGVISIPKLELEMPIYLGATYRHMADGAAHLSQTACPSAARIPTASSRVTAAGAGLPTSATSRNWKSVMRSSSPIYGANCGTPSWKPRSSTPMM